MKAWEKNVRTVVPYVPGEQPNQIGMIKLNTNENPYPPAPGVQQSKAWMIKRCVFIRMRPQICW